MQGFFFDFVIVIFVVAAANVHVVFDADVLVDADVAAVIAFYAFVYDTFDVFVDIVDVNVDFVFDVEGGLCGSSLQPG